MVSTLIFWGCLNTEDSHQSPIIYSWAITLIEASKVWNRFVSYSPTRSNTQRISSYFEEIMNVPVLTEYTDSTMNVSFLLIIFKKNFCSISSFLLQAKEGLISNYGKHLLIVSIVSPSPPSSTKRFSVVTAASVPTSNQWSKLGGSWDPQTFPIRVRKIQIVLYFKRAKDF